MMTLAILLWGTLALLFQTETEGRFPCLPDTYMASLGPNTRLPCLHSKHLNHLSTFPRSASTISNWKKPNIIISLLEVIHVLSLPTYWSFPIFYLQQVDADTRCEFLSTVFIFSLNSCNYLKWFDALDEFEEVMTT